MIYAQTLILAAILAALVLILRKPIPAPVFHAPACPAPVVIDYAAIARVVADAIPARVEQAPQVVVEHVPQVVAPQPMHSAPILWEVCHKSSDAMIHKGFVRDGTPDYHAAYSAPGVYLRNGETVIEGVQ